MTKKQKISIIVFAVLGFIITNALRYILAFNGSRWF